MATPGLSDIEALLEEAAPAAAALDREKNSSSVKNEHRDGTRGRDRDRDHRRDRSRSKVKKEDGDVEMKDTPQSGVFGASTRIDTISPVVAVVIEIEIILGIEIIVTTAEDAMADLSEMGGRQVPSHGVASELLRARVLASKRTVFVQQLAARLETRHLFDFFNKVGRVKEAQIVKDHVSGCLKCVGYVEFYDEESVAAAIELTCHKLKGVPIIAQHTEAEKNCQALRAAFHSTVSMSATFTSASPRRTSTTSSLAQYSAILPKPKNLETMHGFELAGRPIRVSLGNDKFTPESTANREHQGRKLTWLWHMYKGEMKAGTRSVPMANAPGDPGRRMRLR
ncbi:uncharacterized protein BDZ99DRAFT_493555 [Mytilinidion resinicola]|uniref:RRM domain-containing protein n=1 Tax=Mytilinidion resinicola TaxID=574789 RepID=A0A6A6ZA31_9PEZI|nr:uncharacterized protein BDZ99DRAFT_493555 [Mytilinidion resinicola]KAF2817890.1 hypothetical protein BDZ99DRAFT_493555 [Mytilinidion resinicola]